MGVAWCNFLRQKAVVMKREQPRLQPLAVAFYVILALRSCSRGPPLLPLVDSTQTSSPERIGDYFWEPDDREHFHFSAYLSRLLKAMGHSVKVFGSMYGKCLAPYQAALLRSDWEVIRDDFQVFFRSQCAAYRFLNGGKHAPKIRADLAPTFEDSGTATSDIVGSYVVFGEQLNTFMNFKISENSDSDSLISREYP